MYNSTKIYKILSFEQTKSHHRSDSFQGDWRKERKQMAKVSLRSRLNTLNLLQATASCNFLALISYALYVR
ncbi:hypothetical protein COI71_23170 [Bacillus cereus]|nr:hypothetical protein CON08_00475 [Bacillus cereus]PFI14588.1 hypothetical protein COI71_23170 [Bacillus cereus]